MEKMLTVCDGCQRPGTHDDELTFRNTVQHSCNHVFCDNCMDKAWKKESMNRGQFVICPICVLNHYQKETPNVVNKN